MKLLGVTIHSNLNSERTICRKTYGRAPFMSNRAFGPELIEALQSVTIKSFVTRVEPGTLLP